MMSIQLDLAGIGMDLDAAKQAFYAELEDPQPDSEVLEQIVEDYRDALDELDTQARYLRPALRQMERSLTTGEIAPVF